jgi:hypothetical protein
MGNNIDIDAAGEKVGTEFEYRQFTSDTTYSNEQQRWKLLDGIAKHAPGVMQKGVERSSQLPLPPVQMQERKEKLAPRESTPRQEAVFRSPRSNTVHEYPLPTQPERHSFGHLFEAYTENEGKKQSGDDTETSLKALLRQINS